MAPPAKPDVSAPIRISCPRVSAGKVLVAAIPPLAAVASACSLSRQLLASAPTAPLPPRSAAPIAAPIPAVAAWMIVEARSNSISSLPYRSPLIAYLTPIESRPAPAVIRTGIQIDAAAPPVSAVEMIAAATTSAVEIMLAMRSVAAM